MWKPPIEYGQLWLASVLYVKNWDHDPRNKFHAIPCFPTGSFAVHIGDHLRFRIICGPIWGSCQVWGSFAALYRSPVRSNVQSSRIFVYGLAVCFVFCWTYLPCELRLFAYPNNIYTHYVNKLLWNGKYFFCWPKQKLTASIGSNMILLWWTNRWALSKIYFLFTITFRLQFVDSFCDIIMRNESFNRHSPFLNKALIEMLQMPHFVAMYRDFGGNIDNCELYSERIFKLFTAHLITILFRFWGNETKNDLKDKLWEISFGLLIEKCRWWNGIQMMDCDYSEQESVDRARTNIPFCNSPVTAH